MILIALAGVGAGAINAVVGSGTLVTFPTLVAFGFPPVTATMSNAIGLVAGSVSGTWGYRRELRGQGHRLALAAAGVLRRRDRGRWLLLHLPETIFKPIVPVLLIVALILVVVQPRMQVVRAPPAEAAGGRPERGRPRRMVALVFGTYLVGVYGGYFAAAQGILLVGVWARCCPRTCSGSTPRRTC